MRDTVVTHRPDLLELAIELVGADPFEHVADGTRFAQPAIYCASLAGWERLGAPEPAAAAGHSLASSPRSPPPAPSTTQDGLRLAVRRGELMQEAAEQGGGGMLAVLGSPELAIEVADRPASRSPTRTRPSETILAGPRDALDKARREAQASAGRRAIRLPVKGAFHSPEMEPALAGYPRGARGDRLLRAQLPRPLMHQRPPFDSPPTNWPRHSSFPCAGRTPSSPFAAVASSELGRDRSRHRAHQARQAKPRSAGARPCLRPLQL